MFFLCSNVAFAAGPDEEPVVFCGKTYGRIVPPNGPQGFGWDPIFMPAGYEVTFAQVGPLFSSSR
jgi:inosine triphosphate pyrophosphatase